MAIKAFFALALVLAVTIGLLLPTPGANKPRPTHSSIETIELRRG
jgi:hypothetical protein